MVETRLIVRIDGIVISAESTFLDILTPVGSNANHALKYLPCYHVLKDHAPRGEELQVKHIYRHISTRYIYDGNIVHMKITPTEIYCDDRHQEAIIVELHKWQSRTRTQEKSLLSAINEMRQMIDTLTKENEYYTQAYSPTNHNLRIVK